MNLKTGDAPGTGELSIRAVSCGAIAVICLVLAVMAVVVALLPSAWLGHPYLRLVETIHPGTDAPDNWALASTYLLRFEMAMVSAAPLFLFLGNPRFWIELACEQFLPHRTKVS